MYTKFSSHNTSAARWLCNLKHELPPFFTPSQWLECINGLLEGDTATWADAHPRVKTIMTEENLQTATDVDIKIFQTALCTRFPPSQLRGITAWLNALINHSVNMRLRDISLDLKTWRLLWFCRKIGRITMDLACVIFMRMQRCSIGLRSGGRRISRGLGLASVELVLMLGFEMKI